MKRLADAGQMVLKTKSFENSNLTNATKHTKITTYIAKELKSRQFKVPLVRRYIDCAKAEPLHFKNNTVKERFVCLFKICLSQTNLKPVHLKKFQKIPFKDNCFLSLNKEVTQPKKSIIFCGNISELGKLFFNMLINWS